MMSKNVGGVDAAIRAVLGSLLMVLAASAADQRPFWALGAALVALMVLVTALAGVCPLYMLLGADRRPWPRPRLEAKRGPRHQVRSENVRH